MKRKILNAISTIAMALVMFALPIISTVDSSIKGRNYEEITAQTRTVSANDSTLDFESVFNEYDDANLTQEGSLTTFEGNQTLKLDELELDDEELDEETLQKLQNEEVTIRYKYTFDYVTDKVTLTAVMVETISEGEVNETIIDTIEGKAFVNDAGDIDAELDLDGETILLSELRELGVVDNCGWLKKAWKKVTKAVKKVTKTAVGVVGAVATVVVPAAIGVVCAATGVGLVATIALGAVAGAAIASTTAAASTIQQDGKIDWETVGVCAGVGAVVGAVVSGASYGITKAVQAASSTKVADGTTKATESAGKAADTAGKSTNTLTQSQKSTLEKLDNVIENNLKDSDFSGTLRDLNNNPVSNGNGGFFNHKEEMQNSYRALQKTKTSLEGSLKNPNLSEVDRKILEEGLEKALNYIKRIEDLFGPFGGI